MYEKENFSMKLGLNNQNLIAAFRVTVSQMLDIFNVGVTVINR